MSSPSSVDRAPTQCSREVMALISVVDSRSIYIIAAQVDCLLIANFYPNARHAHPWKRVWIFEARSGCGWPGCGKWHFLV